MVHIKKHVNNVTVSSSTRHSGKKDSLYNKKKLELKNYAAVPTNEPIINNQTTSGLKNPPISPSKASVKKVASSSISESPRPEPCKVRIKRAVSEFFCSSRIKPNSIKIPSCPDLSRGLFLAIVFVILFFAIIIWFIFTDVGSEEDMVLSDKLKMGRHSKFNKFLFFDFNKSNITNITELYRKELFNQQYEEYPVEKSQKWLVFFSTISIVFTIIVFVFFAAIIHYFRSPVRTDWSPNTSFRQNMFTSIFSYNRHLNNLYLIDQAIARDEAVKSRNAKLEQNKGGNDENSARVKDNATVFNPIELNNIVNENFDNTPINEIKLVSEF